MNEPIARAVEFESRKVYSSHQYPGYACWVSFFRGERGQWYLTCEEVTRPEIPLPQCSREQWYCLNLPSGGYDKSQYRMEVVLLESTDDMKTWKVISREPCRYHHTAGTYANQMRTRDGRFLRFVGAHYDLNPKTKANETLYESSDEGKTWQLMPPFMDARFASYPHRLRMLRDGTLVLFTLYVPLPRPGTDRPMYNIRRLDVATGEEQMLLFFSHDQGRTWQGPTSVYPSNYASETDFVELPSGDLLFIRNSIFANPGRQIVYRDGNRFTPGPLEPVKHLGKSALVPETVCLTEDNILIGCMRCSEYMWSDDLGQSWWRIQDIPVLEGGASNPKRYECYQPCIEYLGNGRVACAGHCGADDPLGLRDQYLNIHFFKLDILSKQRKQTHVHVERMFDEQQGRYPNTYKIRLTCDNLPLPNAAMEFWYVDRYTTGFDDIRKLDERMKSGGTLLKLMTDRDGVALVSLDDKDNITDIHMSYQFIVRFNADRLDRDRMPCQSPQYHCYAVCQQDAPLKPMNVR